MEKLREGWNGRKGSSGGLLSQLALMVRQRRLELRYNARR